MKKPIVINLFGGPGSGKSTGAAHIFSKLKKAGLNVELVTEFAKDKTWEHNQLAIQCQEYIFGEQSYRLHRCRNDVDIIVTDSPLPLSVIYKQDLALDEHFDKMVMNVFNTYNNYNYFINRVKDYKTKGRNETEKQSILISKRIKENLLNDNNIEYKTINGNTEGYDSVIDDIIDTFI